MSLTHQEQQPQHAEPRYDSETLSKVTRLAQELQSRHQQTMTAREMEEAGAEVGLDPAFIRRALAELAQKGRQHVQAVRTSGWKPTKPIVTAWWAVGWMLPMILGLLLESIFHGSDFHADIAGIGFFAGWTVYIGGGIILGGMAQEDSTDAGPAAPQSVSRSTMLEMLFALQRELEGQKRHRAFLSVDVVGSSGIKQGQTDLAVEFSFGQFRRWLDLIVTGCGGEMHSAAGDGTMCAFPDDAFALRAARRIQEGIAGFNADHNRLSTPFRVRCGVSAGEVAVDPSVPLGHLHSPVIDRAAHLQKQADPGGIVAGVEVAGAALTELGDVASLPDRGDGMRALAWRGTI